MTELELFAKTAAPVMQRLRTPVGPKPAAPSAAPAPAVPPVAAAPQVNPTTGAPQPRATGDQAILQAGRKGQMPMHLVPQDLRAQVATRQGNREAAKLRTQRSSMAPEEYSARSHEIHAAAKAGIKNVRKPFSEGYDAGGARARAQYDLDNPWLRAAPVVGAVAGGIGGALSADENQGESAVTRGLMGAAAGGGLGMGVRHGMPYIGGSRPGA